MAYYDYVEDRALIKGAFCRSFSMLPEQFEELTYRDYIDLFPSIDGDTTFANVLRTRMETDSNRIKDFSKSEYAEWIKYKQKKKKFDERYALKNKAKNMQEQKSKQEKMIIAQERLKQLLQERNKG